MRPEGQGAPTVAYVLPLRWELSADLAERLADLAGYLQDLAPVADVVVVDGSPPHVFAAIDRLLADCCVGEHVDVLGAGGRNGKVAGVMTGVRHARHGVVVIADDDVRWLPDQVRSAVDGLGDGDLLRPANVLVAGPKSRLPWHARWDTGRCLLNRALGHDHPGSRVVRRSTLLAMGGYYADVLFENLELIHTMQAFGGRVVEAPDLLVARRPPSLGTFGGQRVRQAYDDLAQPGRLVLEAAVLPVVVWMLVRPGRRRWLPLGAAGVVATGGGGQAAGRWRRPPCDQRACRTGRPVSAGAEQPPRSAASRP